MHIDHDFINLTIKTTCSSLLTCLCILAFQNGDVRLVNANNNTSTSGRLEVYYRGQWGTVCDDAFNNNAAMVVCRQLGFNPDGAVALTNVHFGRGADPIWLDNVNCNGSEPNIDSCYHNPWGSHDCGHHEDVGVFCVCNGKSIHYEYIHTYVHSSGIYVRT